MTSHFKNRALTPGEIFCAVGIIIFCFLSCVSPKKLSLSTLNNETEIIKALEYKALIAEFKLDTAAISGMMDDNFISVGLAGINNKHWELQGIYRNVSQMRKEDHIIDSLYLDDFQVQLYDKTAIATFFTVTKGRIKGIPFENRRWRWYDVWIKKKNQWKLVSSQGTPLGK